MIEKTKTGEIKNFSVSDAHHLYFRAIRLLDGKILKSEAIALSEPSELKRLDKIRDPDDGLVIATKWAIDAHVIKALLENGDCIKYEPPGLKFEYLLKPMKYASELKHKG